MTREPITLAGITWTPRPFSAAEHQRWSELATEHHLDTLAAAVDAHNASGGGTTREKLLNADIAAHQDKLDAYLTDDGSAPRPDLLPDERLEAYEIAATIDDLKARADRIKQDRIAESLILQNQHLEAVHIVLVEFAHYILERDGVTLPPLGDFAMTLTDEDLATLESVVSAGKLPTGLSALARRERATYEAMRRLLTEQAEAEAMSKRASGSGSGSTLEPQASRKTVGTKTRSRKPSSRSKQPS